MLETKEQKQIFAGCLIVVVVLGGVVFFNRPKNSPPPDYAALQKKSDQEQTAYGQYLASLGTTPQAQQQLFEQILPQAELQSEVAQALNASQIIAVPKIADSQIKVTTDTGKAAVENYLSQSSPVFDQLNSQTQTALEDLYNPNGSIDNISSLMTQAASALSQQQKIPVPKEAVDFQKQLIAGLQTYIDLLKTSKAYMADNTTDPWPQVYKDYSITAQVMQTGSADLNQLNQKYNLLTDDSSTVKGNWLVPKAQAQFAVIDVWQKAQQILEAAAAQSIARFVLDFMNKLANKIEQTYRISNFLYYSDALVSGQYTNDYLNKYVPDPVDQAMVRNFIPQISCGNPQNNQAVFQAKANQYLGFDPTTLNPNDPQFYQKMARVGNFFSSAQGWQDYYQGVADQAEAQAQQAANNEILSSGQKAGRDPSGNVITPPVVSADALAAVFQRYANEGSDTGGFTVVQQITSQIATNFLNNFVLQGVVLLEQKTCISVPQAQLVTQIP